jgi:uncharacterized membrane protein
MLSKIPLDIFLMYAGGSLALAIAMVAITKSYVPGVAQGKKKPILLSLLSALVMAGLMCLCTYLVKELFTIFWIFVAIFIVGGIGYRALVHKKYFNPGKDNYYKILSGEILFSFGTLLFTIAFFSALEYFVIKNTSFLFYPVLMSGLTFFLPLLLISTFVAGWAIPEPDFNSWAYPNTPIKFQKLKPNERELLIAFELSKRDADRIKTNFRARGPESMLLGDLFYHFLNDYNEDNEEVSIEISNGRNTAHDWWFRKKARWYQRQRVLDPHLDLYKNLIKENTIVICERIKNNHS